MSDKATYPGPNQITHHGTLRTDNLTVPAVQKVDIYEDRHKPTDDLTPFDVLYIISCSYAGKQIFFQEKNGMIYDRYNQECITLEEAVDRMAKLVGDDGSV